MLNQKLCSVCGQAQFETPSGITCWNGHGGAESIEKAVSAEQAAPTEFEVWLRTVCFQKPTDEAYDLAKSAWISAQKADPSGKRLYWELDADTAKFVADTITAGDEPTEITLSVGKVKEDDGTIKYGLRIHETEYPEEGASLLVEMPEPKAAPACEAAITSVAEAIDSPYAASVDESNNSHGNQVDASSNLHQEPVDRYDIPAFLRKGHD